MLTRPPSQRDVDTNRVSRDVRDLCCGHNGTANLGHPGAPSHHWREDDSCGESVEWDLLWVGPDDVVIIETIVVAMQVAIEP